ncbi:MAG: hypothetical protein JXQ29_03200 [Planctomycetes bacterium]|nr:hypothetical protein [Planctomycetota bacterium]
MVRKLVLVGLALVLAGCTHTVAKFALVAPEPVRLMQIASSRATVAKVRGEDDNHILVVVPWRWRAHDMHVAMKRAIETVPGGIALLDCEVRETKFHVPFIYGYYAYVVEGRVLVDPLATERTHEGGAGGMGTGSDPVPEARAGGARGGAGAGVARGMRALRWRGRAAPAGGTNAEVR